MIYRGVSYTPTPPAAAIRRPRMTYRGADHLGYAMAAEAAPVTASLRYRGVTYEKPVPAPGRIEVPADRTRRMSFFPARSPAAAG